MNETPNNLCTHFLEACRDRKSPHARQLDLLRVIDAPALDQIARWLAFGQKFFLPCGGYRGADGASIANLASGEADVLNLPFAVTVLEYRLDMQARSRKDQKAPLWGAVGDKRITLLVNIPAKGEVDVAHVRKSCFAEPIDPELWDVLDSKGGVMVFALWFDEPEQLWSIGIAACVLPRSQSIQALTSERADEMERDMARAAASTVPGDLEMLHVFVPCLMGTYARLAHQHGHQAVQETMRNDVLSDACVAVDFLHAFHCANVLTEPVVIDGMQKLNKKREKSGKLPFFAYRVLVDGQSDSVDKVSWLGQGRVDVTEQGQRIFLGEP